MLANKMKLILPHIISLTQSAFVMGRHIQDNYTVAFEMLHYLKVKTNGKVRYPMLKIDISKTYDRLE